MIRLGNGAYLLECTKTNEFTNRVKLYMKDSISSNKIKIADFTVYGKDIEFLNIPKDYSYVRYSVRSIDEGWPIFYEYNRDKSRIFEMETTVEWCPNCDEETDIMAVFEKTVCSNPNCKRTILPCSICETQNCMECPLA